MIDLDAQEVQRIKRRSTRAAVITALGALIILTVFGFSAWELAQLNDTISKKRQELTAIEKTKVDLQADMETLEAEKKRLDEDVAALRKQSDILFEQYQKTLSVAQKSSARVRSRAPIVAVAVPGADAEKISEGLYDFSLFLDVPRDRWSEIEKVSYYFNHPTFLDKLRESRNPRDKFRVGYRGWGALRNVVITIHLKSGKTEKIAFDMAEAINKAQRVPVKGEIPVKGDIPAKGDIPVK